MIVKIINFIAAFFYFYGLFCFTYHVSKMMEDWAEKDLAKDLTNMQKRINTISSLPGKESKQKAKKI